MANNSGATATQVFGATSTTDEVLSGTNLRGKRILVTGVSGPGLGVETARALAYNTARPLRAQHEDLAQRPKPRLPRCARDAAANGGGLGDSLEGLIWPAWKGKRARLRRRSPGCSPKKKRSDVV